MFKESWRLHVPYADHFQFDMTPENHDKRFNSYVSNFAYNGGITCGKHTNPLLSETENNQQCTLKYIPAVGAKSLRESLNAETKTGLVQKMSSTPDEFTSLDKSDKDEYYYRTFKTKVNNDITSNSNSNSNDIKNIRSMLMSIEGTPDYHVNADIPEGLKRYFPHVKIIVTTRNDLSRIVSTYQFFRLFGSKGRADLSALIKVLNNHKEVFDKCMNGSNNTTCTC